GARIDGVEVLEDLELLEYLRTRVHDASVRAHRERRVPRTIRPEICDVPVAGTGRLRHGNGRSATLVRTDRADLRQPLRPGVRVVQRRPVGAPTRRAHPFAEPCEWLDGRGTRRAYLRLQSRRAPQLLRRKLVVELEIARSQHPLGAEVHREGDGPRSEIVRQVPQRAEAVFVPDEGEEARSDGVLAEAARPF